MKASKKTEDDADEDRPVKKKKKKKKAKQGPNVLLIGGAAAIVIVLIAAGGLSAFIFLRPAGEQKQKQDAVAKAPDPKAGESKAKEKETDDRTPGRIVIPKMEEGNPAKKGGTGIISSVRGAGYRTERRSELKQIGALYITFFDEYKGANRTLENFLKSIKRDSGPIHDYIKEGYYQMNMNARLEGSSVICYERDMYSQGYQCVMGSGEVKDLSDAELKAALGK
jgi:hypothetical protein